MNACESELARTGRLNSTSTADSIPTFVVSQPGVDCTTYGAAEFTFVTSAIPVTTCPALTTIALLAAASSVALSAASHHSGGNADGIAATRALIAPGSSPGTEPSSGWMRTA